MKNKNKTNLQWKVNKVVCGSSVDIFTQGIRTFGFSERKDPSAILTSQFMKSVILLFGVEDAWIGMLVVASYIL